MKVSANIKYLRISAQKLRLSADLVRGMSAKDAINQLHIMPQKSARLILDGLKSAIANAENNFNLKPSALRIEELRVDKGPSLKRIRPRARGSADRINHPMAHLKIILNDESVKADIKENKKVQTMADRKGAK